MTCIYAQQCVMTETKWTRRKDARPNEILEAATQIFVQQGYSAARLDDVARSAGIAKGTLYRYFENKEELFRAVIQQAISDHLQLLENNSGAPSGSISDLVRGLLKMAALQKPGHRAPALARLVVAESQQFPDLATIWHDNVLTPVLGKIKQLIERAQEAGEIRPGDSSAYAFSVVGPLVAALLFREVFGSDSPYFPDLSTLATQHAEVVLRGLLLNYR